MKVVDGLDVSWLYPRCPAFCCSVCHVILTTAVEQELRKALVVAVGASATRLRKKLHRQFVLLPVAGACLLILTAAHRLSICRHGASCGCGCVGPGCERLGASTAFAWRTFPFAVLSLHVRVKPRGGFMHPNPPYLAVLMCRPGPMGRQATMVARGTPGRPKRPRGRTPCAAVRTTALGQ
jgi:hypothetical protein